jgi:kinetochore protein Spc25, fungi type
MNRAYRAGKVNLSALLAQDNPKIDLKLDVYEASTRNFLKAVSNYSARAMTEISHRRDVFNAEQKRIAERIQAMESEINQCKLNEIELMASEYVNQELLSGKQKAISVLSMAK